MGVGVAVGVCVGVTVGVGVGVAVGDGDDVGGGGEEAQIPSLIVQLKLLIRLDLAVLPVELLVLLPQAPRVTFDKLMLLASV